MFGILNKTKNYLKDTGTDYQRHVDKRLQKQLDDDTGLKFYEGRVFTLFIKTLGGLFLVLFVFSALAWVAPEIFSTLGVGKEVTKWIAVYPLLVALAILVLMVVTGFLGLIVELVDDAIDSIKDWLSFRYSDDHIPHIREWKDRLKKR
tara:strand:- start:211 stop:654 length:444 start_codon:yes stop_codon:yes gene_type:complete